MTTQWMDKRQSITLSACPMDQTDCTNLTHDLSVVHSSTKATQLEPNRIELNRVKLTEIRLVLARRMLDRLLGVCDHSPMDSVNLTIVSVITDTQVVYSLHVDQITPYN